MKIGTILTATDLNPLYCDFIPVFIRAWKAVMPEANIVIVLIADSIPEQFLEYAEHIHLWKPIENMHTAFQAQCIRVLYPALVKHSTDGILITDMDMLPTARKYYTNSIESLSDDAFVAYRNISYPHLHICYNVASSHTWATIFSITDADSIILTLQKWYKGIDYSGIHGGKGWTTDEIMLSQKVHEWNGNKIILNDAMLHFKRLCRSENNPFKNKELLQKYLRLNYYKDFHSLRPFNEHKMLINFVLEQVEQSIEVKKCRSNSIE